MIPDTTLWTPLVEAGAGWLIDTDEPQILANCLHILAALTRDQRTEHRRRVRDIYAAWWVDQEAASTSLFGAALALLAESEPWPRKPKELNATGCGSS